MPDPLPPPSIPPEPTINHRRWYPTHEHTATAIGYLCFEMANLELALQYAFNTLMGCSPVEARAIFDSTGVSMVGRCDLILKIATLRKPSDEWFQALEAILGHITQAILPKRNRWVHDMWPISGDPLIFHVDDRTDLQRAQSRQPREIRPAKNFNVSLQDIWDITRQASLAGADLSQLYGYRLAVASGKPPLEFPALHLQPHIDARLLQLRQAPQADRSQPQSSHQ